MQVETMDGTFCKGCPYGNVEIFVDGSVSTERAKYMRQLGASIFVGGTAGIFKQGCILQDTIPLFMSYIK